MTALGRNTDNTEAVWVSWTAEWFRGHAQEQNEGGIIKIRDGEGRLSTTFCRGMPRTARKAHKAEGRHVCGNFQAWLETELNHDGYGIERRFQLQRS